AYSADSDGSTLESGSADHYSLYVERAGGDPTAGSTRIGGNLEVEGSCTGCFGPDTFVQNADGTALEAGDLVALAGSKMQDGHLLILVHKAQANDPALAGVIGQAMYIPDGALVAAYEAQKAARRAAQTQYDAALAAGNKAAAAAITVPAVTI